MLPRTVSSPRRRAYCREVPARGHHGVGGLRIPATCIACNPTRREGGVEPPQPGLCSPGRHRCSRRGKSLERGCGRRPSRRALERIGVLRLMLRTQPRAGNWPAPVFASRKIVGARLWSQTQPQRVGDDWSVAADASHTAALRELAGRQLHPRGCLLSNAPLKSCSRSRLTRPLTRPRAISPSLGGSVKVDRSAFGTNLVLAFLHVLRRNRTGEAKSTGPNSGFEIFVRGVRTYSLDES